MFCALFCFVLFYFAFFFPHWKIHIIPCFGEHNIRQLILCNIYEMLDCKFDCNVLCFFTSFLNIDSAKIYCYIRILFILFGDTSIMYMDTTILIMEAVIMYVFYFVSIFVCAFCLFFFCFFLSFCLFLFWGQPQIKNVFNIFRFSPNIHDLHNDISLVFRNKNDKNWFKNSGIKHCQW